MHYCTGLEGRCMRCFMFLIVFELGTLIDYLISGRVIRYYMVLPCSRVHLILVSYLKYHRRVADLILSINFAGFILMLLIDS